MSTASVAIDIISTLDAYAKTEDGKKCYKPTFLNYWGFSYGKFLGQTFASTFPYQLGRVVLDGVLDPDEYVAGTILNGLADAEEAFLILFLYCHLASPFLWPFFTGNMHYEITLRFEAL
jgi:pimeloyl-ACP methyl ester carboxylesterase